MLVLLGLLTRPAALALLGMVAVIQLFIYPMSWPDHIQWLAFMLIIIARGPGAVSLDAVIGLWARPIQVDTSLTNPALKIPPLAPKPPTQAYSKGAFPSRWPVSLP